MFRSFYHLHVKGGGRESFPRFVRSRLDGLFHYYDLVQRYRAAFGRKSVKVVLHEDLAARPRATIREILDFIGYDKGLAREVELERVKASVGDATMKVLRWRNWLLAPVEKVAPGAARRVHRAGIPGIGRMERVMCNRQWARLPQDKIRSEIRQTYASSKSSLFASIERNIRDYDYPQPTGA